MPSARSEVEDFSAALRHGGVDTTTAVAWANVFGSVVSVTDAQFDAALAAWELEMDAERYYNGSNVEFGALLLEAVGDESVDAARQKRLYQAALRRAEIHASGATSGGEGMARMLHVQRIRKKIP